MTFYAGPRGDKNIYILDASCAYSPDPGCLIPPRLLVAAGNSKGPSFSPDSEWITFALSETEGDPDNEIYIVRVDGSALYKLTDNDIPDWQPRWEP
jgi:Tol biopolymer transport system component